MPGKDALKAKDMKRKNGLWEKIISVENLQAADVIARKGKLRQYGVIQHDKNRQENILALNDQLRDRSYRTSQYTTFKVFEPKERTVFRLPYYPDRIVHHAVMNHVEPIFVSMFTADTYSCIKGRGIHGALRAVKQALRDEAGTKYCLKLDIVKFYPSVNHAILKRMLRRKFKDQDLLWLLEEIIDSADGLPIGNYLSQYFANFYLTGFDHWLKEIKRVRYYFRYADDLVFFAPDKESLHHLLADIREYLWDNLKLKVKGNYQVFPVESRGVDFLGYVFRHHYTRMRKAIKKRFARLVAVRPNFASIAAYYGWACHCNSNHLLKKLLSHEQFQRPRDQSILSRLRGRQHQDRKNPKPGNPGSIPQDRGQFKEARDQMPVPAIGVRGAETGVVHRRSGPTRSDPANTGQRLPFHDNHRKGQ
jgi:RNA-directed DNA polymerase